MHENPYHKDNFHALATLKKVDAESLWPPEEFQVILKFN